MYTPSHPYETNITNDKVSIIYVPSLPWPVKGPHTHLFAEDRSSSHHPKSGGTESSQNFWLYHTWELVVKVPNRTSCSTIGHSGQWRMAAVVVRSRISSRSSRTRTILSLPNFTLMKNLPLPLHSVNNIKVS